MKIQFLTDILLQKEASVLVRDRYLLEIPTIVTAVNSSYGVKKKSSCSSFIKIADMIQKTQYIKLFK